MDFAALQHSVFLQALGSAILNSLWQCFILWLIYEIISASYKSASARFKNNLGTVLLFISFGWFLAGFVSKILDQHHESPVATIPAGFAMELQPVGHTVSGFTTLLSYASASLPYLSVAYIFLLLFLTFKLLAAYRYVYFISSKRLIIPTAELQLFASKVAGEIGITKKISVWISHHIDVPATIGFIKPVILIPLASINNLSCSQLEAIILHELAHIQRNDYFINLIISIIETVLFFNPFVVLLSGIIKRERENCCDDFVLQYRYDPHSYASALLRLEQSRMNNLKLAIGAVSGKKQLLSRIKRITNSQVVARQFNYGQRLIALLLVTALICSVAWLSPEEKKSVPAKALAKKIKPVAPPKIKSIDKAPVGEIMIPGKPVENLPAINIKPPASPKNELVTENYVENLSPKNSDDEEAEGDNGNQDTQDFFSAGKNSTPDTPDYPEAVTVTQPPFYFSANNFKLPPLINIQNFLLQSMNLNIDLSRIDMGKLNENLNLAYKQIEALDWKRVQNEIRKSFPRMRLRNLAKKDKETFFYLEKARDLTRMNSIHARQAYSSKALLEGMKNGALLQDSMRRAEDVLLWNDNNIKKIQKAYKKAQQQYETNTGDNYKYYYNYSNDNAVIANNKAVVIANNDDEEKTETPCQKNNPPSNSFKKTIQISVKHGPSHTGVLNEKKPLQFSFYKSDEKSNGENVIRVEVDD